MGSPRLWQDMTTNDFEALDSTRTVALFPVGAIEQHGPHLPVSTDAVIAEAVAHQAATLVPHDVPVIVLPTAMVGKSNEHLAYPGTLTHSAETLLADWLEIGASVARAGLRKIVFLNAHGGQPQIMEIVVRELRIRHKMMALASNWWSLGAPEGLVPDEEARHGIHGGQVETSMMLHLRPDLVRMDRAENFRPVLAEIEARYRYLRLVGPISVGWQSQDLHPAGVAGNAAAATPAIGAAMMEHATAAFAGLLAEVAGYPLENLKDRPGAE